LAFHPGQGSMIIKKHRGILTSMAVGALALASLTAAVLAYLQRLPDPETADRRGLLRWLVVRDLRREPAERQQVLVVRLEKELRDRVDLRKAASRLNPGQRDQLRRNVDLLAELWFRNQVERFFAQPAAERQQFLAAQLADIQTSGVLDQLYLLTHTEEAGDDPDAPSPGVRLARLLGRVERWMNEASPADRQRMGQFVAAVQAQLLLEKLQQWGRN
jgi:hypothetical protein